MKDPKPRPKRNSFNAGSTRAKAKDKNETEDNFISLLNQTHAGDQASNKVVDKAATSAANVQALSGDKVNEGSRLTATVSTVGTRVEPALGDSLQDNGRVAIKSSRRAASVRSRIILVVSVLVAAAAISWGYRTSAFFSKEIGVSFAFHVRNLNTSVVTVRIIKFFLRRD